MKNIIVSVITGLVVNSGSASAAISAVSEDFSAASSITPWSSVGATSVTPTHSTESNDIGAVNNGDQYTDVAGDGVGDGGLFMNLSNATVGDEALQFSLIGSLELGEQISLTAIAGAYGNSFANFRFEFVNLTDGNAILSATSNTLSRALVDPLPGTVSSVGDTADNSVQGMQTFNLNYTALATDVGDTIAIRLIENGNNQARDILLDNIALTSSVPEPSSTALLGLGGLALIMRRRK